MAAEPPKAPKNESPEELGFTPQPMVGWFTPSELIRSGVKALLSGLFGAYADRRETQAALGGENTFDYSDREEIWLDFVADAGDGFDSTYAVARLIAERELPLSLAGKTWTTRRGDLLLLGGDEVYPTATSEEYRNRLVGPYRAAFPWGPHEKAPHVFAIPGNHDWYDGLTSFIRVFCQEWRWVGGWMTKQRRSYFALKLREDLWVWGIDVQLGSDVDEPQIKYFQGISNTMPKRSKIILLTAEPSWVYAELHSPRAYRNLELFERQTMCHNGHRVVVGLAGDLHTYARYEEPGRKEQLFVAGGGGAYLYPTHDLPKALELAERTIESAPYRRRKTYPAASTSRRLSLGSLLFPFKNPAFSGFIGAVYLFYTWIWQSASRLAGDGSGPSLLEQLAHLGMDLKKFQGLFVVLAGSIAHSPQSILLLLLLFAGLVGYADRRTWRGKLLLGGLHTGFHLAALMLSMWLFAWLSGNLGLPIGSWWQIALQGAGMLLGGGLLGGSVMGLYFLLSNFLLKAHTNEVFICQRIPDYKHFVRLHVGGGKLTIYPIGIDRVPRRWRGGWRLNREAAAGEPWFEPAHGAIGKLARLIEEPIEIPLASSS